MTIEKTLEDKVLKMKVSGRVDTTTAPDLEKEIRDCIDEIEELDLDLGELEYISSAGLRVLLSIYKTLINEKQGKLAISNVNETVMEVFQVTGFDDILHDYLV